MNKPETTPPTYFHHLRNSTGPGAEGLSPLLELVGFHGRLERLLALARARQIDLALIALPHLVLICAPQPIDLAQLQDRLGPVSL